MHLIHMNRKAISAFVLAMGLLFSTAFGAYAKVTEAIVNVSSMEVRSEPNESGELLGTLKKGTKVEVHDVKNGIAKIVYNGKKGYARLDDLKKIEEAQPTPPPTQAAQKTTGDTVKAESAKVYASASTDAKVVATLKKGATVQVLGTQNGWTKLIKDGKECFIQTAALIAAQPTPIPTPTPAPTQTAQNTTTDTVKVDSAKVYASTSTDAKVVATLKKGATVQVLDAQNGWTKLIKGGKECFIQTAALVATQPSTAPTPAPTATTSNTTAPSEYTKLQQGDKGEAVKKLQTRLESLGHFDGVPGGNYLSITVLAVKRFQAQANIKQTGVADEKTQALLYSSGAPVSDILSKALNKNSSGTNVKRLQQRLQTKGYYGGSLDGDYGVSTADAVKRYQAVAGLSQTGEADVATLKSLYSSSATSGNNAPATTPLPAQPTASPSTAPKPTAAPSDNDTSEPAAPSSSKAETVITAAMAQLSKPYVYGATGMSSFDCSGLTQYAYKQVGVSLSRTAYAQGYNNGKKVTRSQLKRGDLVCFNTIADADLVDHVGIYLGNNQFIHASSGSRKVVISTLSGYYDRNFSWGRRVL